MRVHTGGEASALARSRGALGYTIGSDVVLGASYVPGSTDGRRLLAHELVHVVQQRQGRAGGTPANEDEARFEDEADRGAEQALAGVPVGPVSAFLRKDAQYQKGTGDPPDSTVRASLTWFEFTTESSATFEPGDKGLQVMAMILKNLLGPKYTAEARDRIEAVLTPEWCRTWNNIDTVKDGDRFPGALLTPEQLNRIIAAGAQAKAPISLAPEKQQYLELGLTSHKAYREIAGVFAKWFTRDIFDTVVANHVYLLQRVASGAGDATDIGRAIGDAVDAVEAIRRDTNLVGHDGYSYLWPRDKAKPPAIVSEDTVPRVDAAASLITYAEARPRTARAAASPNDTAARKTLLDGFVAAYDIKQLRQTKKGDVGLRDFPSTFTAPPYPSTLTVYPPLDNGLYGSTRADYGFEMALQFPNVFSTFQFHDYDFKAFRVPDDKLVNAAAAVKGPGRSASHWDTMTGRLARDKRYAEADVRAYGDSLWEQLGPPGLSVSPTKITAALRYIGTVVGSLIEAIFDPSDVARFKFEDEGLYVVRCVATYDPGGEMALRRPPSVAWVILFPRSPELLAEQHLQTFTGEQDQAKKRIDEIDKALPSVKDAKHKGELEDERKQLVATIGGVEGLLTYQREMFAKSKDQRAQDRVGEIDKILGTRAARGFDKSTERLPATFVNDAGQVIDLLIEVKVSNQVGDVADYAVNDATTPGSVSATRRGNRHDAIVAALKAIFEDSDYGRGRATVLLDGGYVALDIATVSSGKLFMEALANTATILSIVAIALAPATGGESMVLMMPAMIIGAIPSVYNIVKRGLVDKTLHADLALAMDIVNVVGAAVGVGAETRAGMQAVRLGTAAGKVIVVLGVGAMGAGVLVMGASIVEQLEAVRTMPEGLQQAEVIKIISSAMLNAGILMGGLLAAHARGRSGGEGTRTFEEWLSGLDEKSRADIEASRAEKDPAKNIWRVWAEMDPVVRDLLTQCGSFCVGGEPPSKADQARLKVLAEGLSETGYRTLQGLLHDNREPAAFQKLLSGLEAARTAAPRSKGGVKKIAAVEGEIRQQGTIANDLLAKLSEEAVNTRSGPPDPKRWERTVKLAQEVGAAGKIPLEVLRALMDHLRTVQGSNPEEILLLLRRLGDLYGKVPGVDNLLGTRGLLGRYLDFEGARFTLQFLEDNSLWNKVKAFEDPVPGGDRAHRRRPPGRRQPHRAQVVGEVASLGPGELHPPDHG